MAGLRPALAGDHQIIAAPRQLDGIGNVLVWRIRFSARPAIDHMHAQRGAANRNRAADAAEAKHAHGFAADAATEPDRTLAGPAAVTHVTIREQALSRGGAHQSDRRTGTSFSG